MPAGNLVRTSFVQDGWNRWGVAPHRSLDSSIL